MKKKVIICLIIFFIWLILVLTNNLIWFDESIYFLIHKLDSDNMTKLMNFFTFFAETKTIIVLSILALIGLWFKKKWPLYLDGTIAISTIINVLLKLIIRRERPNHITYVDEKTYSFPSGHAMASMSFYGAVIVIVLNSNLNKKIKYLISFLLGLLIFLIGVSRIYLGVHYPSDIIGGWLVSIILLIILDDILKRRKNESINNRSK